MTASLTPLRRLAQQYDSAALQTACRHADLWLSEERVATAEAWIEAERDALGEVEWCALVSGFAQRLAECDRHAQAEEWLHAAVGHYPQHLPLYVQLAQLAQLQGRALQAIALLRRAIRLGSEQDAPIELLWTRVSAIALQFNPRLAREAVALAEAALSQSSERNASHDNAGSDESFAERCRQVELAVAGVEAKEEEYDAAEQRYRRLLKEHPDCNASLHGMGQLFMQLGRIAEAIGLFERVTEIDPARGHGALIHAHRFPEDDATLGQLEQLARTPTAEGSARTGLLFQLAAAWEKRRDYPKAFALADEANAASRRLLRYDSKAHRQRCARIRHAFPRALYEHRPGCGHDSNLPVFVVGMPRSGTTLVEQILAGHSRIHGAGELGMMPRVIAGLERWERHTGSGRHYPDCVDDLDPQVSGGIAEGILRELRAYAPDADHVVDKLPHNFENIGLIHFLFPRAKIISLRRDPRDIAVSNYFTDYGAKHGGMGFAYDLDWIGEQLADHDALMRHWLEVCPDGILEVHYEDLVDTPESCARSMLAHIGVAWEPQVLDFDALERPIKTASVWQVRQPLYASSKGRWQRYRAQLKPLIAGARRRLIEAPIEMVTLPEPGWLNSGVDHYRDGDLNASEYRFKQLLHYLPEHAGARFMLGLIHLHKGYREGGITLMTQALERCPWNRHWRSDLAQAYLMCGREQEAAALLAAGDDPSVDPVAGHAAEEPAVRLDYLFLSGEATCARSTAAATGADS